VALATWLPPQSGSSSKLIRDDVAVRDPNDEAEWARKTLQFNREFYTELIGSWSTPLKDF
ncbi:MAG: hypothetical protein ACK50J_19955, partial [Planctomyces sp.]